jgi:hypothetical protein
MTARNNNQGAYYKGAFGEVRAVFTAGSATYDNALGTSEAIDRKGFDSAKLMYQITTTLATTETVKAVSKIWHCTTSDGTYALHGTAIAASTTLDLGITTADKIIAEVNYDLAECNRYIKVVTSMDLSASGTDTCAYNLVVGLGGTTTYPVTATHANG